MWLDVVFFEDLVFSDDLDFLDPELESPKFFFRDVLDCRCALAVAATAAATMSLISFWSCFSCAATICESECISEPRGDDGGEGEWARSGIAIL